MFELGNGRIGSNSDCQLKFLALLFRATISGCDFFDINLIACGTADYFHFQEYYMSMREIRMTGRTGS